MGGQGKSRRTSYNMMPNNAIHLSRLQIIPIWTRKSQRPGDGKRQRCTKSVLSKLEQHSSSEMPTIMQNGPYRVYFYIHVPIESASCSF
jgi:hypothetical protein